MLHLIRPLGFELDDKKLRRAGLDYREFAEVTLHDSLDDCLTELDHPRVLAISTRGHTVYSDHQFDPEDAILLGPETRGLPADLLASMNPEQVLRIPMQPESRSLNLSNAAALVLYEAWRQHSFGSGI